MMNDYFLMLETKFEELLSLLAPVFTLAEQNEVRDFLDVGEYGLALETAVGVIVEGNKCIDEPVVVRLRQLRDLMKFDSPLVEVLLGRDPAR